MKENSSNQQATHKTEPEAVRNAFHSDEEMLKFYLTMNRFLNPTTYETEQPALQRLYDLHTTLSSFFQLTGPIGAHSFSGMDNIMKGYGLLTMRNELSIKKRYECNAHYAYHVQFFFHLASNQLYAKKLSGIYQSHIKRVAYLIKKLENASAESSVKEVME